MRLLIAAALLMSPTLALAETPCAFSEPRSLDLNLDGARSVYFKVNANNLHLQAVPGERASLTGRACAADADRLKDLKVVQTRDGDRLIVELIGDSLLGFVFGNGDAYLDIHASVPETLRVQLDVGAGDVWSTGGSTLSVDVASGDADIRNVRGRVTAKVNSGDLKLQDIGSLNLLKLNSGDVTAHQVRGPVTVGSVGSGDLTLATIEGPVEIGAIGSGDVDITRANGRVSVESIDSGDLDVQNIAGDFILKREGSGDEHHRDVHGQVFVPRED